jgi:UBX domain-containing protein 1
MGGQQVPPQPEEEEDEEPQTRALTFWQDGFSIEDGPLMRYDEPKNKDLLEAIQSGRAPPSLFGVRYNQPLQINVTQRTGEKYTPPPKVYKPFEGAGNRLGSAAPEVVGSGSSTPNMPGGILHGGSSSSTAPGAQPVQPTEFSVDASKPTTSIQLRLGDGTK